jgi:hypothetical protein
VTGVDELGRLHAHLLSPGTAHRVEPTALRTTLDQLRGID